MDFGVIRDAALLVLMFLVFGVPALAIAARIAIRPVLDAIVHLRESFPATRLQGPDPRLAVLEDDVRRLSVEVQRLSESEKFMRQLIQATSSETLTDGQER